MIKLNLFYQKNGVGLGADMMRAARLHVNAYCSVRAEMEDTIILVPKTE